MLLFSDFQTFDLQTFDVFPCDLRRAAPRIPMIDPQPRCRLCASRLTRTAGRGIIGLAACLLAARTWAEASSPPPLTRIADVLALPSEQVSRALPVHVRGVVTWQGHGLCFTLQDDTGGIYVSVTESIAAHLWQGDQAVLHSIHEGSEVELEGRSNQGGMAPNLYPVAVRVLGTKPLPQAAPMDRARFFEGGDLGRRIEVRAVVQGFQPTPDGWTLQLGPNPSSILADITRAMCANPAELVDAEIRICGVTMTRYNTRGEAITPRLITNLPQDLVIEKPAPPPETVPQVSLGYLQPYHPDPRGPHRVRVQGTVTFSLPGQVLYLQDGVHSVRVETKAQTPLQAGDQIEAAGFVDMTREIGMLRDATVNRLGGGKPPAAIVINPEEIMAINQQAVETGHMAQPHDFDGHLICFRARLLAVQADPGNPQRRLLLERPGARANGTSNLVLQANLQSGPTSELDTLQPGSEVEVTGLVQLAYGQHKNYRFRRVPAQLDLILRSAQDVVVIQAPSWWTAQRLVGLLGGMILVLAAAIGWSLLLERKVRRKTLLLTKEMRARRDAAVEFQATLRERNLLAANLHDTLLQTMGGLGFQLEACEAEAESPAAHDHPPVHLAFARRMLDHAVDELRNSVWTLRSLPLDGMSLPEALTSIASRMGAGRETRIVVLADAILARVPDFVAGNLLLVAQEALHNALKHAAPHTVTLEVQTLDHPPRISLTVRDDGTGFSPGTQLSSADGHFGLLGMRERIDRLAGTFRIQSAPGHGTILHAEVPLHAYDDELADRPIDSAPPVV